MVGVIQVNGTRGEITPLMHARADTEFYQAGYAECLNTIITRYGPHTRTPGTLWLGATARRTLKTRMLAFEFSDTQKYALEFGGVGTLRFWTPDGQVYNGSSPYEIASPYIEAELPYLHARQSGDVLYLFCNGKRPKILKRLAELDWQFSDYVPKDGPYLDTNDTPTTLSVSANTAVTNIVPKMTSNVLPAPVEVSSTAGSDAWKVFNRSKVETVTVSATESGYIKVDLGSGNKKVMDNYFIIAGAKNAETDAMFSQWDIEGSQNDTDWVAIDSRDNEKGWAGSETRYYETSNKTAFRYYRLTFSGGSGTDPDHDTTEVGGWYMHQAADDQTPWTLHASSVTGINKNTGFKPEDVGRSVRLQGSDGRWRWAEIKEFLNVNDVKVVAHGQAFLLSEDVQNWRLGAWSDTTGWPRTGRFFEDRMALAGWPEDPIGMALSVNGAYDNFRVSSPLVDDDAITIRMTGGRLDTINWLAEAGTLLVGTAGGLRSVGSRDSNSALKNDNVRQKLETSTAASRVQPAPVENVSLFVDRTLRRLYETGYDYNSDGYIAREVSVLNDHLFEIGIERIEFIDAPYKLAVALRVDGKVVFFNYDREQKIAGGTLADFGGLVEDIMVLEGGDYQELWMVVKRTRGNSYIRTIEKMAPFYNGRTMSNALPVYAACSVAYTGDPTTGLENLTMLEGVTVGVWADGRDIGDTVVTGGTIVLPEDVQASRVVIGERMRWRLKSLPLPILQNPNGNGLGSKLRIAAMTVDTFESARVYGGGVQAVERLRYEGEVENDPSDPENIASRTLTVPVDDSWQNRGQWVITGNSMFPATIRGVSLEVEMEP